MTPDETSSRNWFIPGHRKRSDRTPNWSGERPEVGRLPKAKVRRDRTWCMHTAILPMTHSCARRGARAWPTLYTTGGNASVTCKGAILAHANWELRIHTLLTGRPTERLDPAIVGQGNDWDLGRLEGQRLNSSPLGISYG